MSENIEKLTMLFVSKDYLLKRRKEVFMKIIDVIKYEGDNKTFVWRYPEEDFNTMSQLIVHETQVAVLFKGGKAQDEFLPGEYRLHTKNIPILNKLINLPSDGVSPFHCVVYYVNKTEQMNIKWGFGEVIYEDPNQGNYPFKIGAHGSLSLKISDAKAILNKLVGTENILTQDKIIEYFKSAITMHIKDLLPKLLKEKKASIFEVENYLPEVSEKLRFKINEEMTEYGVEVVKLWTEAVVKPENDPLYQRVARIRADQSTIIQQGQLDLQKADFERRETEIRNAAEINVEKYRQDTLGYTYQQQRAYDVMQDMAKNEGTGSDIRNAFVGMGVGFGTAGVMGKAFENVANETFGEGLFSSNQAINKEIEEDNYIPGMVNLDNEQEDDNSSFRKENTTEIVNESETSAMDTFEDKVKKLKIMYDNGLIKKEKYDEAVEKLMESII